MSPAAGGGKNDQYLIALCKQLNVPVPKEKEVTDQYGNKTMKRDLKITLRQWKKAFNDLDSESEPSMTLKDCPGQSPLHPHPYASPAAALHRLRPIG